MELNNSVLTSKIQINGFHLIGCDRNRYGGRVACYTRNDVI